MDNGIVGRPLPNWPESVRGTPDGAFLLGKNTRDFQR